MREYQRNRRARLKEIGNTETGMIVTYNQSWDLYYSRIINKKNNASALVGFDSYDPSFLMALPFATAVRIIEMTSDAALPDDKKDEAWVKRHAYQCNRRARLKDTGNTKLAMMENLDWFL